MGKVNDEIKRIQIEQNLTLPQVFDLYPHLAKLQYEEMQEEKNLKESSSNKKQLLLD